MKVFTCPHCGKANEADETLEGTGVHCAACGQPFVLTASQDPEGTGAPDSEEKEESSPAAMQAGAPMEPALGTAGVSIPSQLPRGAAAWGCLLFVIVLATVIFLLFSTMADKRQENQEREREQDRKEKVEQRQDEVEKAITGQ